MEIDHFGLAAIARNQGRSKETIEHYLQGLALDPHNHDALMMVGVLLVEQGQVEAVIERWQLLVQLIPDHYQAIHNLGVAYAQTGDSETAIQHLRRALELKPDYAEAHYNLGNVLNSEPPTDPARLRTDAAEMQHRREQAVEHFFAAIRIRTDYIEAYHNLGTVLTELQRPTEAVFWLEQAVRLCRNQAKVSAGDCRESAGQAEESNGRELAPAHKMHSLLPSTLNQLGLAYAASGAYRKAERCYQRALDLNPGMADAHSNLGNLYQDLGRLPEALVCYELALIHDAQSGSTRWNRSLSLLQTGDFEQGWREYESRWRRKQTPARPFRQDLWDGSSFSGRTLLIWMEQGLGDMLQFIRFGRLAKERGGRVMVECPGFLAPLLSRCEGIDGIVIEGEVLPEFDLQIPVMSLPLVLGITLATLPSRVPYVFVEDARCVWWREWVEGGRGEKAKGTGLAGAVGRVEEKGTGLTGPDGRVEETGTGTSGTRSQSPFLLGSGVERAVGLKGPVGRVEEKGTGLTGPVVRVEEKGTGTSSTRSQSPFLPGRSSGSRGVFRVGIVWQGNPNHRLDRYRSIALREFGVLAQIPGVRLVSLQRGPGAAQIRQVGSEFSVLEPPHSDRMTAEDLLDTAALMRCLDLVISVDTGAAHLAGALGVPVWVPLSAIGEWRWLLHREDSPWYPTMRLFRQNSLGKWGPVFRRMAAELERLCSRVGTRDSVENAKSQLSSSCQSRGIEGDEQNQAASPPMIALPVQAVHAELSVIASAIDDTGPPSQRLLDVALQAVAQARQISLASVKERTHGTPNYLEVWPGEHYKLLAGIVAACRPNLVLEIGTATGLSALAMRSALPEGTRIVTFDLVPWQRFADTCFLESDFADGSLEQILGDLSENSVLQQHAELIQSADFIFVDGPKDGQFERKLLQLLGGSVFPEGR